MEYAFGLPDPLFSIEEVVIEKTVERKSESAITAGMRTMPGQWIEPKRQSPNPTIGSRIQRAVNKGRGYAGVIQEIHERQANNEAVDLDDAVIDALRLRLHAEVVVRRKLSLALKKELDRRGRPEKR